MPEPECAHLPEIELPADPLLAAQGWERRFMADAERAREASELYASLGFEVTAQPVRPSDLGEACAGCTLLACREDFILYTRRKS